MEGGGTQTAPWVSDTKAGQPGWPRTVGLEEMAGQGAR